MAGLPSKVPEILAVSVILSPSLLISRGSYFVLYLAFVALFHCLISVLPRYVLPSSCTIALAENVSENALLSYLSWAAIKSAITCGRFILLLVLLCRFREYIRFRQVGKKDSYREIFI